MQPDTLEQNSSFPPVLSGLCSRCHQPTKPEYYFCPNCGNPLRQPPLDTSIATQIGLYVFSIILPMMGFIFVTKWKGNKYYKSEDQKSHAIGQVAWALIVISTIVTIWYAIVWTQNYINSTVQGINSDLSTF